MYKTLYHAISYLILQGFILIGNIFYTYKEYYKKYYSKIKKLQLWDQEKF